MPETAPHSSLIRQIGAAAAASPERAALREKRQGIWVEVTYAQMMRKALRMAQALTSLGLSQGGRVLIAAENSVDSVIMDLAAQMIGAAPLHVPNRVAPRRAAGVIRQAAAAIAFCGNQEHFDAIMASEEGLLRHIVVGTGIPPGMAADPRIISLAFLESSSTPAAGIEEWLGLRSGAEIAGVAVAAASYEDFELVENRSDAVLFRSRSVQNLLAFGERDGLISIVPFSRPAALLIDLYGTLLSGAVLHFPESPATVLDDLRAVQPGILHVNGRALTLLRTEHLLRLARTGGVRKRLTELAERLMYRKTPILNSLAYWGIGHWVGRQLGLSACRLVAVTDGDVSDDDRMFFETLRRPVMRFHGATKHGGVAFITPPRQKTSQPLTGTQAKLAVDGEILVSGPTTSAARNPHFESPHWDNSGELGSASDGRFAIDGLKRNRIAVQDRAFSPELLERKLTNSSFIRSAVFGIRNNALELWVQIEFEVVAHWAIRQGHSFSSYSTLVSLEHVRQLLSEEVDRCLSGLGEAVPKYTLTILSHELDQAADELGADLLPRRTAEKV